MKRYRGIRYGFRPVSYWKDPGVVQAVLRNVKGQARRQLLRQALAEGRLDAVSEVLQMEEIPDGVKRRLGRIHPWFMGGEYLPGYAPDETEIARVRLQSATWDVISIRARWENGRIGYRVVDEYRTEFRFEPESSKHPFSLAELIAFVDGIRCSGLYGPFSLAYNEYNMEEGLSREDLESFTAISSDLYPQLSDHFQQVYEDWVKEG
jgi:hypothetical protein